MTGKDEYGLTWYARQSLFHLARAATVGIIGKSASGNMLVSLGYARPRRYGLVITDEGVLVAAVLMLRGALSEPEPGPTFDDAKAAYLAEWATAPSYHLGYLEDPVPDARMGHGVGELLGYVPQPSPGVVDDEDEGVKP